MESNSYVLLLALVALLCATGMIALAIFMQLQRRGRSQVDSLKGAGFADLVEGPFVDKDSKKRINEHYYSTGVKR